MTQHNCEKPLCIIPARGGSKRLPKKNIALLAGKPLLVYAIEAARTSKVFGSVCVSSEDEEILRLAEKFGAEAIKRKTELATDTAAVKQVCQQLLIEMEDKGRFYKEFAVLLTTNPLRSSDDIQAAYEIFKQGEANYVMSLVEFSHPPQRAVHTHKNQVKPYFGMEYMTQTQRLEPLYRHDGTIIIAKTDIFLKEKEFYGSNVKPYFQPVERSVDIDNALDLKWAEFLLNQQAGEDKNGD